MTHEEAKNIGATHYDDVGIYYKETDVGHVYMLIDSGWLWYTHIELLSEFEIKPL